VRHTDAKGAIVEKAADGRLAAIGDKALCFLQISFADLVPERL